MTQAIGKLGRFSSMASDPLRGFRFYAEFKPAENDQTVFSTKIQTTTTPPSGGKSSGFVGGFTQVGGLQVNVQDIPYREGGYNVTAHHIPGLVTYTPVVMQRGVLYGNDQAMEWINGLIQVSAGAGLGKNGSATAPAKNFRCNVEIFAADHPNTNENLIPRIGWRIYNAWITNLNYTDLNSVANEVMFETMTLIHEGMEVFFTKPDGKPVV